MDKLTQENIEIIREVIKEELKDSFIKGLQQARYNLYSTIAFGIFNLINAGCWVYMIGNSLMTRIENMEDRVNNKLDSIVQEADDIKNEAKDKFDDLMNLENNE